MKNKYKKLDIFIDDHKIDDYKDDYENIFLKAQDIFGYISEDVKEILKWKII